MSAARPLFLPTSDESGWPTTKKFPRSLHGTDAAWRDSSDYATPIEFYAGPSRIGRWLDTAGWIAAPLLVIAVCAWVWFKAGGGQ